MEQTKTSIRKFLLDGELEKSKDAALEYSQYCGLADITNGLTVLSSQLEEHQQNWRKGIISYEKYSLTHAQLSHKLNSWIERLPNVPVHESKKSRLLSEEKFKKRIFYLLILIKVIVVIRLLYHWSTGGFSVAQVQATATLLIPAFAGYITVILAAYLKEQKSGVAAPKYITGPLITFAYILFPLYAVAHIALLELKVSGPLSFAQMTFWMALVESILGGYIGQIVYSFFKKED